MRIEKIVETKNLGIHDSLPLSGYVIYDFLDRPLFEKVKKLTYNIFEGGNTNTFLTHNTKFNFNEKEIKLAASGQSNRYQHVIFDYSLSNDWYYQTNATIHDYINQNLVNDISPLYYKVIKEIEKVPPFCNEVEKYVCFRQHLNVLTPGELLTLHLDGNPMLYNTPITLNARSLSVTYYMEDHTEGKGGELWSLNGFVYKPKANSLIIINGIQSMHGVNANMTDKIRMAYTTRWAYIDDLYLPGHPDKFIYNINYD